MNSDAIRLFEDNMKLVYHVCGKFRTQINSIGIDYEDAQQEGFIALIEAAKRFDPRKGFKFSTYACSWIAGCVQNYIRDSYLVRSRRGDPPQTITSLDTPVNDEIHSAKMDLWLSQESDYSAAIANEILCSLPSRERIIVRSRLEGKTQGEIAAEIGVSQAHISRLLKRVRKKLDDYYDEAV